MTTPGFIILIRRANKNRWNDHHSFKEFQSHQLQQENYGGHLVVQQRSGPHRSKGVVHVDYLPMEPQLGFCVIRQCVTPHQPMEYDLMEAVRSIPTPTLVGVFSKLFISFSGSNTFGTGNLMTVAVESWLRDQEVEFYRSGK